MNITFTDMEKSLTGYCKNNGLPNAAVKVVDCGEYKRYALIENGRTIYESQSAEAVAVWVDCLVIARRYK